MINVGVLRTALLVSMMLVFFTASALGSESLDGYVKYRFVTNVVSQYYESSYDETMLLEASKYWPADKRINEPVEMVMIRALTALSKGHRAKFLLFCANGSAIKESRTKTQKYAKYFRLMSNKFKDSTVKFVSKITFGVGDDLRIIVKVLNVKTSEVGHFVLLNKGGEWVLTDLWYEDAESKWIYEALSIFGVE